MKPPEVLLILNDATSSVGTTSQWCEARNISYEVIAGENLTSANVRTSSLIIFGGDMQVWETEKFPWLVAEKNLIRETINSNGRIFGICLGAQLLIEQLGGKVEPLDEWHIGWYPVSFVNSSLQLEPLHWHKSQCRITSDVKMIASNSVGVQAFEKSKRVRGFQFHTEINSERLAHALKSFESSYRGQIQSPTEIEALARDHIEPLKRWYFEQLDHWWSD